MGESRVRNGDAALPPTCIQPIEIPPRREGTGTQRLPSLGHSKTYKSAMEIEWAESQKLGSERAELMENLLLKAGGGAYGF